MSDDKMKDMRPDDQGEEVIRQPERDNLERDSSDVTSRLALAAFLARRARRARRYVGAKWSFPREADYAAARVALADAYLKLREPLQVRRTT